MSPALQHTLVKVAIPLAAMSVIALMMWRRRLSARKYLALTSPPVWLTLIWLFAYAALMLGSNWIMNWRGPWDFQPWAEQGVVVSVLRVLAVGVLGPIMEEVVFRGLLFTLLMRTRLGVAGTIIILALAWGAMHYAYTPAVIALLTIAGIILGCARYTTQSVIPPILMHVMWNLYAVW